jgi:hypothetical protein
MDLGRFKANFEYAFMVSFISQRLPNPNLRILFSFVYFPSLAYWTYYCTHIDQGNNTIFRLFAR